MATKIKQKLNITKAILVGSLFATTLTSTAFAAEKQTFKNHPGVLSGAEVKAEANKSVINKEDRASFIRFLKCIEQAHKVNNSYSFEEYPIFIKALEEMQYLQGRGFKIADLMNDIGTDKDHAEWFKHVVVTGTSHYARFIELYEHAKLPVEEIKEAYENRIVRKQSELIAAKAESDASKSLLIKNPSVEDQKNKEDPVALKESFNNKLEATMHLLLAVDKEKWMDEELRSELMDKIFKVLFPNEKELAALRERIGVKLKNKSSGLNPSSGNTKDVAKGTELFTVPVNSESEKFKIFAQDADDDEMRRRKSKVRSLQKASRLQGTANEESK